MESFSSGIGAHVALERQLPKSDSHLVVYQLVVPQLAVLRLPRRRIRVVRLSGDFSTVLLPEFYSTQQLATPRRLPCTLVHLNTSEGIHDTWSNPSFSSSQIVAAPHHGRISCIDVFSPLRSVTCQSCGLYRTCRILFEQRSLSHRSHFIGSVKVCVRICGQQLTVNRIVTQQASR